MGCNISILRLSVLCQEIPILDISNLTIGFCCENVFVLVRDTVAQGKGEVPKWLKGAVCKTVIHRFESGPRLHSINRPGVSGVRLF